MANKPKEPRTLEAIQLSGYVFLFAEGPRISGASYPKLCRMRDEGRLATYGNPAKVDLEHLISQVRGDYPQVDRSIDAA